MPSGWTRSFRYPAHEAGVHRVQAPRRERDCRPQLAHRRIALAMDASYLSRADYGSRRGEGARRRCRLDGALNSRGVQRYLLGRANEKRQRDDEEHRAFLTSKRHHGPDRRRDLWILLHKIEHLVDGAHPVDQPRILASNAVGDVRTWAAQQASGVGKGRRNTEKPLTAKRHHRSDQAKGRDFGDFQETKRPKNDLDERIDRARIIKPFQQISWSDCIRRKP